MALIPPDAGIRMRMQTEANLVQQLASAHELPADLPDLQPGRTFSARIQEALPENTFKALVGGKSITLALPEGARTGDQLELVVVDRTAKAIIARQVDRGDSQPSAQPYAFTKLSPTAQLIGQLLSRDGTPPLPTQLNQGQPLLDTPPVSQQDLSASLASALAKSVTHSGLFYESHQAQWIAGKVSLAELLQEPQGQRSAIGTSAAANTSPPLLPQQQTTSPQLASASLADNLPLPLTASDVPAANRHDQDKGAAPHNAAASAPRVGTIPAQPIESEKVGAGNTPNVTRHETPLTVSQQVPEELQPIVQQQLEALASQRMIWHGEIWPQQAIDWEIEWQEQQGTDSDQEGQASWRTAVSLKTPRLGQVDATLLLSEKGVRVSLSTPHASSAGELLTAAPSLADALAAAGIPLLAFQVKQENEYPAGQR